MGKGTLLAREPDENQARVSGAVGGSMPADGRDMGATTATSGTARAGAARGAREEARPGQTRAQRATLLEQAKEAAAKLAELMIELSESGAPTHPDEADMEDQLKLQPPCCKRRGPEGSWRLFRRMWSERWPLACSGWKNQGPSRDGNAK